MKLFTTDPRESLNSRRQNRWHFFSAAAEAMRRILTVTTRSKPAGRRLG